MIPTELIYPNQALGIRLKKDNTEKRGIKTKRKSPKWDFFNEKGALGSKPFVPQSVVMFYIILFPGGVSRGLSPYMPMGYGAVVCFKVFLVVARYARHHHFSVPGQKNPLAK